uniref:Methyltransf_21 domain-containing protein n=1 Tax=Caenorhabditis tropicalis TaxID=1561998 RepID=A0A1I7URD7_9PELO
MSYNPDELADSLRRIAISCMPVEQRVNLGEQSANFREEERHIPYQLKVVHIDMKRRSVEANVDKHSFSIKQNEGGNVQVTVSDGTGQSAVCNMPNGLSLNESLKKITDYFLGRPGTVIQQFLISSESVLETCNVPEMVHQRYICYDSRNLEKALVIKCPETFIFEKTFKSSMIKTVYQQVKNLGFTEKMNIEIGTDGVDPRVFLTAIEELKDLNPKLGIQPKHNCYDIECSRPNIEYATHLQCLVFDIEGTELELVVCLPVFVVVPGQERSGLNYITRFNVVKRGTVSNICRKEDWLSVFDVEGFVTFVDLTE